MIVMDANKYALKRSYGDDWSLTISNLKSSDQANYMCMKGATAVQSVNLWIKGTIPSPTGQSNVVVFQYKVIRKKSLKIEKI